MIYKNIFLFHANEIKRTTEQQCDEIIKTDLTF